MKTRKSIVAMNIAALIGFGANAYAAPPNANNKNLYDLSMQAMQDAAQKTDVYVTITPKSPNTLLATVAKQIQMKSFDTAGDLRWTKNMSDRPLTASSDKSGSVTKLSYNDMGRYQPVQAQVLVQNAQTTNTEVTKTKIPVLFRPDLTVDTINAKSSVRVGEVVNIDAAIKELNGDLGAVAVVSLKRGNSTLDTANNVRVDPHGNSGVVFSTVFNSPGEYTLTVSVDSANPGDYDTGNNQKTVKISAVDTVNSVPYWLSYADQDFEYAHTWSGWWGNGSDYQKGFWQQTNGGLDLSGHSIDYPLNARLEIRVDSQPTAVFSKSVSGVQPDWTWNDGCYSGRSAWRDLGDNTYFYSYDYNYCGYWQGSVAYFNQYAYDYIQFSEYHDYYWGHYSWSGVYKAGTRVSAKNSVQTHFVVEGANGQSYGGKLEIAQLTTSPYNDTWDYWWSDYHSTGYSKGTYIYGSGSGMTQP